MSSASLSHNKQFPEVLRTRRDEVGFFVNVTGKSPVKGNFFAALRLSPSGGIAEVRGLWRPPRYLGAVIAVSVLLANVSHLLRTDLRVIRRDRCMPVTELLVHEIPLSMVMRDCTPDQLVAVFELSFLAWYAMRIARCLLVVAFPATFCPWETREGEGYCRWQSVSLFFRRIVPELQSFSAMRSLQYVTPAVLTPDVRQLIFELQRGRKTKKKVLVFARFICMRLLFLLFGFEAFLVKFREAAKHLDGAVDRFRSLVPILLFLNQMLGIVKLSLFTDQRLCRFIFGGVDNYVDRSERRRLRVWEAAFQKAAWDAFKHTPSRFVAVSLTFNDSDFQSLVLDEGPGA